MIRISQIKVSLALMAAAGADTRRGAIDETEKELVAGEICRRLRIRNEDIKGLEIVKKSLDARDKSNICCVYQALICCANENSLVKKHGKDVERVDCGDKKDGDCGIKKAPQAPNTKIRNYDKSKIIIVGMGPAGIFAALTLARAGLCPIIVERGRDVDERSKIVEDFWSGGKLDEECNVQFGEGGAGLFSDGKLNTQIKDKNGYNRSILLEFVKYGAPSEILYMNKPHIGTDRLRSVIRGMREDILRLGGRVYFGARLEDIAVKDGKLCAALICRGGKKEWARDARVILASGHSARDTFYKLNASGVYMESKPFAVGVRVEHPQDMIGFAQYGEYYSKLPPADYKLTCAAGDGRGVYSFCMCPGGCVVNASSERGRLAINGMSGYERGGRNANSAIVAAVSSRDFGDGVFSGLEFQRKLEEAAYAEAGGKIPVQLLADFFLNRKSAGFGGIAPDAKGDFAFANVRAILPDAVGNAIDEAMRVFDRKISGFARGDAVVSGVESRTSSPVRIRRGEDLQSNIRGLYPCGEGAGYAGGIMSAALDGIRVARRVLSDY